MSCLDPSVLDREIAGCRYDRDLIERLPSGVDPCGERGEFHTCVTAGPMLSGEIDIEVGEVVDREGFVYADLIPRGDPDDAT